MACHLIATPGWPDFWNYLPTARLHIARDTTNLSVKNNVRFCCLANNGFHEHPGLAATNKKHHLAAAHRQSQSTKQKLRHQCCARRYCLASHRSVRFVWNVGIQDLLRCKPPKKERLARLSPVHRP